LEEKKKSKVEKGQKFVEKREPPLLWLTLQLQDEKFSCCVCWETRRGKSVGDAKYLWARESRRRSG
jgi:hypothetical protein